MLEKQKKLSQEYFTYKIQKSNFKNYKGNVVCLSLK